MYIGFVNIHPITLPLGNELMYSVSTMLNHIVMVYITTIKPDLIKLIEVADML